MLNFHRLTSCTLLYSSSKPLACLLVHMLLLLLLQLRNSAHLYSQGTDTDLQWTHVMWLLSSQSIGTSVRSTEKTASSIVACWTMFTEVLPGNAVDQICYNMLQYVKTKIISHILCGVTFDLTLTFWSYNRKINIQTHSHFSREEWEENSSVILSIHVLFNICHLQLRLIPDKTLGLVKYVYLISF
jgi:hypothetical protein